MNIGFFQMSDALGGTQAEAAPSSAASRRTRRRDETMANPDSHVAIHMAASLDFIARRAQDREPFRPDSEGTRAHSQATFLNLSGLDRVSAYKIMNSCQQFVRCRGDDRA